MLALAPDASASTSTRLPYLAYINVPLYGLIVNFDIRVEIYSGIARFFLPAITRLSYIAMILNFIF